MNLTKEQAEAVYSHLEKNEVSCKFKDILFGSESFGQIKVSNEMFYFLEPTSANSKHFLGTTLEQAQTRLLSILKKRTLENFKN